VGNLNSFEIPLPPTEDRSAIVAFLDRETAKIDALVEEQRRLIELLKEKRQGVISHAVTKGLDPNVPMKDSGVEWLGEVPEHWEILKGARLGDLFGSEPVNEEAVADVGEIPYLKVASVATDNFDIAEWNWYLSSTEARSRKDFVVFPKRGAAILSNKVAIVTVPAVLDPNLMGWAIRSPHSLRFVAYVLKARRIEMLADVSTVPQINNKHIGPEKFPVPPPEEQVGIATFLDAQMTELGDLRDAALEAIDLLQERRAALITAAITGKIDVRGLTEAAAPIPDVVAA
jgi:type I restriction enzyme, S subunit